MNGQIHGSAKYVNLDGDLPSQHQLLNLWHNAARMEEDFCTRIIEEQVTSCFNLQHAVYLQIQLKAFIK
jgi:hypothetical protein